jgi:hypothetical protein
LDGGSVIVDVETEREDRKDLEREREREGKKNDEANHVKLQKGPGPNCAQDK